MRIRYMELPAQVTGEAVRTPYLLVIDECPLPEESLPDDIDQACGAEGVLVFPGRVSVVDPYDTEPKPFAPPGTVTPPAPSKVMTINGGDHVFHGADHGFTPDQVADQVARRAASVGRTQ